MAKGGGNGGDDDDDEDEGGGGGGIGVGGMVAWRSWVLAAVVLTQGTVPNGGTVPLTLL